MKPPIQTLLPAARGEGARRADEGNFLSPIEDPSPGLRPPSPRAAGRGTLAIPFALLLAGCGLRAPVRHTLTIAPNEDGRSATVTVRTEFSSEVRSKAVEQRMDALRAAILDNRDDWSRRFELANTDSERIVFDKTKGVLQDAERSASLPMDELQRFLGEVGTVQFAHGDGTAEITLYPSSSARATRQQHEHVEQVLRRWTGDAVAYFKAVDALYRYLNREPSRANAVFTILFSEREETSTIDEEESLIGDVSDAMARIVKNIEDAQSSALTIDEEFDLVFNPFPAEINVRLPRAILAVEGFERKGSDTVAIRRAGLFDIIASLENRWVSPDPLAILIRADEMNTDLPKPEELASRPRQSTAVVTAREVENEVAARMRTPAVYRVRWSE